VFGESKVTADLIKEYEAAGFFPIGDARAPLSFWQALFLVVMMLLKNFSSRKFGRFLMAGLLLRLSILT
jgi:hypothetical protein